MTFVELRKRDKSSGNAFTNEAFDRSDNNNTISDCVEPEKFSEDSPSTEEREVCGQHEPRTVEYYIDQAGMGWFQIEMLFGLSYVFFTAAILIMVPVTIALECDWFLPAWQQSTYSGSIFVGQIAGALIGGAWSDVYGRKFVLMWTYFFGTITYVQCATSPTFAWLLATKTLNGFTLAPTSQNAVLLPELVPHSFRGYFNILIEIGFLSGTVVSGVLTGLILPNFPHHLGWRYLMLCSASSTLPFLIWCYFRCPESPRWLLLHGRKNEAIDIVLRIYRQNGISDGPTRSMLQKTLVINDNKPNTENGELSSKPAPQKKIKLKGSIMENCSAQFVVTTAILGFIWFAASFSYYGQYHIALELLNKGGICGLTEDRGDSGQRVQCRAACDVGDFKLYATSGLTQLGEIPGLLLALYTIRFGRKVNMAFFFLLTALSNLPLFVCRLESWQITLAICIGKAASTGAFMVAYIYTPEVYPTSIRGLGLAFASSISKFGGLSTGFLAQWLVSFQPYLALGIYIGVALLAGGMALLLPIETGNKQLTDKKLHEKDTEDEKKLTFLVSANTTQKR